MDKFFTSRSFFFGLLLSILVAYFDHYSVDVAGASYMAIDHMPAGAIFLFFFLVFFINTFLKKVKPSIAFSPGELLLVYVMMLVASSVTEMGFGSQILPIISAPSYYTSPQNQWDKTIIPNIRKFLIVTDKTAVMYFYEGLPKGMKIPYSAWIKPLSIWLPFIFTLYFVMICVAVILRKQWMEKERLVYPLTILPREMVKESDRKSIIPAFFKNPLMWLGFGIAFVIGTINGLHNYFEAIPAVNMAHSVPIFRRTTNLVFRISFPVIGIIVLSH